MTAKRALIVDDSKSARTFLSRILEKYAIDVETAESAELAIEHLATHRPDVIFMDHLMPGMDGFQAVQLIKNNPRTATIPIMMYTSQEGELYLGQARALGAVGVLPKQIRPADVSKVLYQLKLVPDRRSDEQETFEAVEGELPGPPTGEARDGTELAGGAAAANSAANDAEGGSPARSAAVATLLPEVRTAVETALHAQLVELRQFVTVSLEDQAARAQRDLRQLFQELPRPAPPPPSPPASAWPWLLASLGALAAVAFGVLWYRENNARLGIEAQLAQANAAAAKAAASAAIAMPDLTPAASGAASDGANSGAPGAPRGAEAAGTTAPGAGTAATAAPAPAPPAAAGSGPSADAARTAGLPVTAAPAAAAHPPTPRTITEAVPYGEQPLAGGRIELLRAALTRAVAAGFHGVVEIHTYAARYCLAGNATDGYSVAPEDTPVSKCDLLGNPRDESQDSGQRESLDFANFLGAFRQSSRNAVEVRVSPGDPASLVTPYPVAGERTTAGEWNRAAAANNRIEVVLHPEG